MRLITSSWWLGAAFAAAHAELRGPSSFAPDEIAGMIAE